MEKINSVKAIVLLLALTVLVAGCNGTSSRDIDVFIGGSQGLLLRFMEGTPPNTVYDNRAMPFDITLSIENAGEFDIDRVHLTLSGISTNDFEGIGNVKRWVTSNNNPELGQPVLAGKTRIGDTQMTGGKAFIELGNEVQYTRRLAGGGEMSYTIMVDACYPYATMATSRVCYQSNYNDGNNNVCRPETTNSMSVSGAPLQVTSYSQEAVGPRSIRVQYTFDLRGNVQIYAPKGTERTSGAANEQDCNPANRTQAFREEGVFYVEVDHQGAATSIRCTEWQSQTYDFVGTHIKQIRQPALTGSAIRIGDVERIEGGAGFLRLNDGRATLTCIMELPESATNHMGVVNLAATYYVKDFARTTFAVTHSGQ
ncbi:MAG: hypothetical protein ACMXYL_03000 [Candidatus Woesearchaeota archaeon]